MWRGVDQPGARYKFWAFQHHCYSDVLALYGDRYEGGGRPVPYLEDRVEYPVLLGLTLWLPAFAPGGTRGHLLVTALLLAACLAAAAWALHRLPGARPWWLAATPALAYYAFLNWDLLPIALTALALLALERGHHASAGAAAALGTAAKLFPVALLPAALGALAGTVGAPTLTAGLPVAGRSPVTLKAAALLAAGRDGAQLTELSLAWPGARYALLRPAQVTFQPAGVDRAELADGPHRLALSGGLGPKGSLDARLEVVRLDLARLPRGVLAPGLGVAGEVSLDVRATGSTAAPVVVAQLAWSGGAAHGEPHG